VNNTLTSFLHLPFDVCETQKSISYDTKNNTLISDPCLQGLQADC